MLLTTLYMTCDLELTLSFHVFCVYLRLLQLQSANTMLEGWAQLANAAVNIKHNPGESLYMF